jgi:ADP-ribose pyrophosphatase
MPTGGLHAGETPEAAAQRELMEEAGYRAGRLTWVSTYYTTKCVTDEIGHLYLGHDLSVAELPPDETEFFERAIMPFGEVLHLVDTGEIRDSMTVIAVLQAARLREKGQLK